MKRLLCSLLIIVILFNFIIASVCYAEPGSIGSGKDQTFIDKTGNGEVSGDAAKEIAEEGQVKNPSGQDTTLSNNNFGLSIVGFVIGILAIIIDIIPFTINILMTLVTNEDISKNIGAVVGGKEQEIFFTIDRVVFNRLSLVNINYFNTKDSYTIGSGKAEQEIYASDINNTIKINVSQWFIICRFLSLIIGLLVLIYVGIRMAISTIASERAVYKKMLVDWVKSVIILFVLQYIIIILINIGEIFTNICVDIRYLLIAEEESFESILMNSLYVELFRNSGFRLVEYSIIFWFLVFIQLKFFFTYMKRLLMVGFLVTISPLITITYSIDKMGDGKAQALDAWIREFMINIFIQPIHAIIYLVFIFTAGAIAQTAPMIGLVFLLALGSAEKMIKTVFGLRGAVSIRSVNEIMKKK